MDSEVFLLTLFTFVILALASYFLLSYLKGSIALTLPRTRFYYGETISGRFKLHAKKGIEGNELHVALVAREKIVEKDHDGKKKTRSTEVFRSQCSLESAKHYTAGLKRNYAFDLDIPDAKDSDFANSSLAKSMNLLGNMFDQKRRKIEWKVEVRLDAKGIDISDAKVIIIR